MESGQSLEVIEYKNLTPIPNWFRWVFHACWLAEIAFSAAISARQSQN